MRVRNYLVWLLIFGIAASPAQAWNLSGHKIIASIAWRQLAPRQQDAIAATLARHPRYAQDFEEQMPEEVRGGEQAARHEWLFQQAAVWPDLVRSGPPEKRAFSRPEWHYVNRPLFLDEASRMALGPQIMLNLQLDPPAEATPETAAMNVVQAIRFARRQLASRDTSHADRAVAVCWLFHLVGDIHQPLHSSAVFSQRLFPEGDRGGNSVRLRQRGNLHALWDGFPGEAMEYRDARNRAIVYAEEGQWRATGRRAVEQLDEAWWLTESEAWAKTHAYDAEIMVALAKAEAAGGAFEPLEVSERYLKAGGAQAEQRMVQAGYRLGAVLKGIFAE